MGAWRGPEGFEGRASLRSWLHRIATNRWLNALRDRGRRAPEMPARADQPAEPPAPTRLRDPIRLEPYPDTLLTEAADRAQGPDARYEAREAIALAFITAVRSRAAT